MYGTHRYSLSNYVYISILVYETTTVVLYCMYIGECSGMYYTTRALNIIIFCRKCMVCAPTVRPVLIVIRGHVILRITSNTAIEGFAWQPYDMHGYHIAVTLYTSNIHHTYIHTYGHTYIYIVHRSRWISKLWNESYLEYWSTK